MAGDEARLSRFAREAKLLASLNHPGVATVYGFEELDGKPFLVLEVIEGPTLAERLQRGPLPWREAVDIGRHIAEALAAAHDHGIVHRDLKPSNIKLCAVGHVKLLDFGLAKGPTAKSASSEVKLSTETSPTDAGMILGTAPYMSPEQVRGEPADHRADVWAFGCVLFEMLTGKRAFSGPTPSDVIAAIIEREPQWAALPPVTPPQVRSIVRRCLAKDPFRRLHAIADARIELEEALTDKPADIRATRVTVPDRRIVLGVSLSAAAVIAAAWAWIRPMSIRVPPATTRFNISVGDGTELSADSVQPSIALSPDGRRVVYKAVQRGLHIRSLEGLGSHLLPGTEGGSHPFFSPDGRWIGFVAGGKLQKVPVDGGAPRLIADAVDPRGATWGADGTILYTPDPWAGLYRISAEGGTPQRLTVPDPATEASHRWPQFLPGNRAAVFTIQPSNVTVQDSSVAIVSLETGSKTVVLKGGTYGRYVPTGHLVYGSGGTLFAAPFDIRLLKVTGPAMPVVEDVAMVPNHIVGTGIAQFDFSHSGALTYVTPSWRPREGRLFWLDREGHAVSLSPTRRPFERVRISPDGRRLVAGIANTDGSSDLWSHDIERQTWARLTFGNDNSFPEWSPQGDRIAFQSNREGAPNVFVMPAEGGAPSRLTFARKTSEGPTGWSPDGKRILFRHYDPVTFFDLWEVGVREGERPQPLVVAPNSQNDGRLSPDGRWLAYSDNEARDRSEATGEVLVTARDGSGRKWTISSSGGSDPIWSRGGSEIFYVSRSKGRYKIWRVPVTLNSGFRPGIAQLLFERSEDLLGYDVAPDDQHFAVAEDVDAERRAQIVFVPDWFEELKAKVPAAQ